MGLKKEVNIVASASSDNQLYLKPVESSLRNFLSAIGCLQCWLYFIHSTFFMCILS